MKQQQQKSRRQRAFGGKTGIWLRHKQSDEVPREQKALGWDDELGRPVYKDNDSDSTGTASLSSSEEEDNNNSDDASSKENDEINNDGDIGAAEEDQSSSSSKKSSSSSSGFTPIVAEHPNRKRKNRRAFFGSRKASRVADTNDLYNSDSVAILPLSQRPSTLSVNNGGGEAEPPSESSSSSANRGDQDEAELSLVASSQDSSVHATSSLSSSSQSTGSPNGEATTELQSDDNNDATTANKQATAVSHEKSVFDFDESSSSSSSCDGGAMLAPTSIPRQPNAATSLTKARAYFARLDAASPLALVGKQQSQTPSNARAGRTRRRLRTNHPAVRAEYQSYRQACLDADVLPMTIEEYSKQRESFADKDKLYDGFLDE